MQYSKFVFSILFSICATVCLAQKTDFSGTWNFKEQESISGKLYSNGSPKSIKIIQSANQAIIDQTTAGANGDVTSNVTIPFDGKAFETKTVTTGRKKVVTLTWNGTAGFTTISNIYNATDPTKLEFKTTDIYTMDEKDLVLQRKAENFMNGEVWESKAYYEK